MTASCALFLQPNFQIAYWYIGRFTGNYLEMAGIILYNIYEYVDFW